MINYLLTLLRSKKGQGMVEYGLIIGLVAVVLIGALLALNGGLGKIFTQITGALNSATPSASP